jgi:hypothetical protein
MAKIDPPNILAPEAVGAIDTPNTLPPETVGVIGVPNTLTPITPPESSTNNARIGYENLLVSSDFIFADKALIPNTYERWQVGGVGSPVRFQFKSLTTFDFIAFGAHTLGSHDVGQVFVTIEYSTTVGGALTFFDSFSFGTDNAIMFDYSGFDVVVAELVFTFDSPNFGATLGVLYAGKAMEMERSIYGGHSPADLSQKTSYQSTMSDSGQFLGRTVTRRGAATEFSWRHLTPGWYRSTFQRFVDSAVTTPFFIKWNPAEYPSDTSFGYTTGDIKPTNMGGGSDLMEVSFNFKGHSDS